MVSLQRWSNGRWYDVMREATKTERTACADTWDLADPAFFGQVYELYMPRVFQFFYSRLQDPTEADDLTGDVFLKAFEKQELFDPEKAEFPIWLFAIARNRLIDYYRQRRLDLPLTVEIAEEWGGTDGASALELQRLETAEMWQEIRALLSEKEMTVIRERYVHGYSNRQIAKRTGVNENTVSTLHRRALGKLNQWMKEREK